MSEVKLEFMASTISEVLSLHAEALFATGPAHNNYEFTVSMDYNLNNILRKVIFPIKVPKSGQEGEPVRLPNIPAEDLTSYTNGLYELARTEFQDNVKSTWDKRPARLMDDKTTPENDNSQRDTFGSTMILLLAILFKKDPIKLHAEAGHDDIKVSELLAPGTEVIDGAVTNWLTNSTTNGHFNKETFTAQQMSEIFDSIQFQNRYKVFTHDPAAVALTPTAPMFQKNAQDYTVCSNRTIYQIAKVHGPNTIVADLNPQPDTYASATALSVSTGTAPAVVGEVATVLTEVERNFGFSVELKNADGSLRSSRIVSDLKDTTDLTMAGVYLDSAVRLVDSVAATRFLYKLKYYSTLDINNKEVWVSENLMNAERTALSTTAPGGASAKLKEGAGFTTAAGNLAYCIASSGIGYQKDVKGVDFDWMWFATQPGPGIECKYEVAGTFYRSCDQKVYIKGVQTYLTGDTTHLYIGTTQQGFKLNILNGSAITASIFVQKMSGIWGCTSSGFGVANGWQHCVEEDIRHFQRGVNRYNISDVYQFPVGSASRFAPEDKIQVQFVEDGNNGLGFSQGSWRELVAAGPATAGKAHPESNILGGQINLEELDAVGIVVDLSSDSVGLNKILPVRLMIQQVTPPPQV